MITLAFLGDVMLGRGVNDELRYRRPAAVWGTTLPFLRGAGAVFATLECAIAKYSVPWQHTPKRFHFRADTVAVQALRAANVRCVSLANNHALDFEEEGLEETIQHLDDAGIAHAGAGRSGAAAAAPAIVRLPGLTVGMIAMTDNEPDFAATENLAGTFYDDLAPYSTTMLAPLAASCRARGANLTVLSLHWGPNMVAQPPPHFRDFAHAAVDAGFDVVHGHSAHVFQGVEIYRGHPIFYDTGDFLDDYAADETLRNDWSFIFFVDVKHGVVERVQLVPVWLWYAQVDLMTGADADAACRLMVERSAAVGSRLTAAGGTIQIACNVARPNGGVRSRPAASAVRAF